MTHARWISRCLAVGPYPLNGEAELASAGITSILNVAGPIPLHVSRRRLRKPARFSPARLPHCKMTAFAAPCAGQPTVWCCSPCASPRRRHYSDNSQDAHLHRGCFGHCPQCQQRSVSRWQTMTRLGLASWNCAILQSAPAGRTAVAAVTQAQAQAAVIQQRVPVAVPATRHISI